MSKGFNRFDIFGVSLLQSTISVALEQKYSSANRNPNPETWKWKPHDPKRLKNIKKIYQRELRAEFATAKTNYTHHPKQRQKVVLVFNHGATTHLLLEGLRKKKLKFFFLSYEHFITLGKVCIESKEGRVRSTLEIGDLLLDLDDVAAVYWNIPGIPWQFIDHSIPEKFQTEILFQKRWSMFLRELKNLLSPDVIWFPGDVYSGAQEWQNRLSEYKIAGDLGICFPETLTTNDPDTAIEFIKRLSGQKKTILFREYSAVPANILPIKIDPSDHKLYTEIRKKLRTSPCTFQEYVQKRYEYRVVVFRDRCFPVRIHSQSSEKAKEDWRVYDDENVKWEMAQLPKTLIKKMQKIIRRLDLNLASFDLIESTDGKYYFLELNRPGNFYWLLGYVGLDVGLQMADYLAKNFKEKNR